MFKTSEKHTFTVGRHRPGHLSFKLTHTNSYCTDSHTNVHLLNMCPADVVAMKKALFCVCVYEREKEWVRETRRDKKYLKNPNIWAAERREIKWTLILPQQFPTSQHEEMKEEQCTFWYLFLLKHTAGVLVWETGPWLGGTGTPLLPGLLIRQKYARLSQWRIN